MPTFENGTKLDGTMKRLLRDCLRTSANPRIEQLRRTKFLERCEALNCGLGSNLTEVGSVECEAAYMSSVRMAYGAVAAVTNCVHPICAAKTLACPYANSASSLSGLVQPMVLAGPGANKLCASLGIGVVAQNEQLRTHDAVKEFRHAKRMVLALTDSGEMTTTTTAALLSAELEHNNNNSSVRFDTVGGVAIDPSGRCEACVSSGGILLKKEGRMGHSAQFGAAIWAEQCHAADRADAGCLSVAISLSGCGEALTRTHFAEELAQQILSMDVDDVAFVQRITDFMGIHFVRSRRLTSFPPSRLLLGGLALIQHQKCDDVDDDDNEQQQQQQQHNIPTKKCRQNMLLAFHNSTHFPFAFLTSDQKIRRFKSTSAKEGQFVCNLFSI